MTPFAGACRRARAAVVALVVVLAALVFPACGGAIFGRQYEYEEDLTLDLDGSAEITINASIPALVALRALDLDVHATRVDRERIRAAYQSAVTSVSRVSRPWRSRGRQFVQIRVEVTDVRKLHDVTPFAWSRYELSPENGEHVYRQTVGASALRPGSLTNVGWDGSELVAFRLHLPSRIRWHNSRDIDTSQPAHIKRGNILAWEQPLADRLEGRPIAIEVRMDSESILHRTLWLFAGAFLAAVLVIVALIWWTVKRGGSEEVRGVEAGAEGRYR